MTPEGILWIGWTCLGAVVGSFLNAFIYRWPRRISLLRRTRSFCPACEAVIRWYDNLPILSYLVLRGKCRACRAPIPVRYLVVEILTAGLFAYAFHTGMAGMKLGGVKSLNAWIYVLAASFVCADLVALAFVDIETFTVPVVNTTSLIIFGLVLSGLWPGLVHEPTAWTGVTRLDAALNSLEGAVLGGGIVWSIGAGAELAIRKEGMGSGDVKILAGVGALLGWKTAVLALFMAAIAGALVGVVMLACDRIVAGRRKKRGPTGWGGENDRKKGITYRYEPDEEAPPPDTELVKSRRLMAAGLAVALVQVAAVFALPGARASALAAAPFYFGATIGFFMVFFDVVRRRLVHEGRWIRREISKAEDGSTEERLMGHYLPFGPFLALAAVVMVFFGPEVITRAARHLFGMY